jgi:hypothetical protein
MPGNDPLFLFSTVISGIYAHVQPSKPKGLPQHEFPHEKQLLIPAYRCLTTIHPELQKKAPVGPILQYSYTPVRLLVNKRNVSSSSYRPKNNPGVLNPRARIPRLLRG